MIPNQQDQSGQGGANLEDRLRGMILNNTNAVPDPNPAPAPLGHNSPLSNVPKLSPHMMAASPAEQQAYLARLPPLSGPESVVAGSHPPGPGKKRPNRAQRRQMSSQTMIPIDPRQAPPHRGHGGFGHQSYQSYQQPKYRGQPSHNQNSSFQQPQSYSPHHGQVSPYSPQFQQAQNSPRLPMSPYNTGSGTRYQPTHIHNQSQQRNQSGLYERPAPNNRQLYQPGSSTGQGQGRPFANAEDTAAQSAHIDQLVQIHVPSVVTSAQELSEKEAFRSLVEQTCRAAIAKFEQERLGSDSFDAGTVQLRCFGSMASGFATKASDMDLALLSPMSSPAPDSAESLIPRLLEKTLLDLGYGARLLSKTRVPIIKLCEKPTNKLLENLRKERAKWESGILVGQHREEDAGEDAVAQLSERRDSPDPGSPQAEVSKSHDQPSSYEEKLAALKQNNQQSLAEYYNAAKRLLKSLGGRDCLTGVAAMKNKEIKILNDVCKAFVLGLHSSGNSEKLRKYRSISPLFDDALVNPVTVIRSLQGIWNQTEGEQLVSAWETRHLIQNDEQTEGHYLQQVDEWRVLQDNPLPDMFAYNRKVFGLLDRLRQITSLQLVFLEQAQSESPLAYLNRTSNIMASLKLGWDSTKRDGVTSIVTAHYIAGVSDERVRKALEEVDIAGATLQQVALHHQALLLALDYENCLSNSLFEEEDKPTVEEYVAYLRSRPIISHKNSSQVTRDLVAKIRVLPDPMRACRHGPRDRYKDHLEYPKTGIGFQCDINFSAELAIHNTQLLRCYSNSDPRVKDMVLFIKHWAKTRGINTPYRGTLSSYGYVLMVLHYLVNIAQPWVCPNLQTWNLLPQENLLPEEQEYQSICKGRNVRFWRREDEILEQAGLGKLSRNHESVGSLLRGFFDYFANSGPMSAVSARGFDWGREVLSLRSGHGILHKQMKGWVGAKTVVEVKTVAAPPTPKTSKVTTTIVSNQESIAEPEATGPIVQSKTVEKVKEVRHRYLFAIEDPFELDHNVARTVTHDGIVSIRDEFRRAWRIIKNVGKVHAGSDGDLLDPFVVVAEKGGLQELLNALHGPADSA